MCLGCMHFRAPNAALKQKIYHNSLHMQPIINYFQGLFKFMRSQLFRAIEDVLSLL